MTGLSRPGASARARVTVGMPVWNNARTLARAIASVQAQTVTDWRLVLSDDASTDGSAGIAERAAAGDPRITVLRQPARTGFENFRVPLALADTAFFAWLAADDRWAPGFLAETLRALEAAPGAVSALPGARFLGSGAEVPNLGFLKGGAPERIRAYLAHPGGTRMYGLMRTDAARAAFPPRTANAWDWHLVVALLRMGPQLSVPAVLLEREETPWQRYAQVVDEIAPPGLRRLFPVAETSLMLIRGRHVPLRALPALVGLNLRKHEEYMAVTRPGAFRRLRPLYRALGLPKARDPARAAAARRPPAAPRATADVTALVTCRNAEATLPAWLAHAGRLGMRVVVVDHGSTDATRAIALARGTDRGGPVAEVRDLPWEGVFDLTRQLRQKRDMLRGMRGWVLHGDADEFVDPPGDGTLGAFLAGADREGRIAVPMEEHLYLPRFEDEAHDAEDFERTMLWRAAFRDRDQKQRLFRAEATLDLWLGTGGHTVTREAGALTRALTLRHYPGLSLDHIRAQYHARVFAAGDLARLWHGPRRAQEGVDVVEPAPGALSPAPEPPPPAETLLPVFARRAVPARPAPPRADLYVIGTAPVEAAVPGLRAARIPPAALDGLRAPGPVLHALRHPAGLRGGTWSAERARAVDWVRDIAAARQWAVSREAAYAEIRAEEATPEALAARIAALFVAPVLRGAAGFVAPDARVIRERPFEVPIRSVAGPMAADLGYR